MENKIKTKSLYKKIIKKLELYNNLNNIIKINLKLFTFFLISYFLLVYLKSIKTKLMNFKSLSFYKHYINDCRNLKIYNRKKIKNDIPYVSICLPVYNMENYIEKAILTIINQSFQDFEIIIVNDYSNDGTKDIIQKLQIKDDRIRIINFYN